MNHLTAVMYHYVRDIKNSDYPKIKGLETDLFIQQLDYLAEHYSFVTTEEVIDAIHSKKPLPNNPILLTFDDGYIDHYQTVYPILKKRGIQGAFFVPSKMIRQRTPLDTNKIHYILATIEDDRALLNEIDSHINRLQKNYDLLNPSQYFEQYKDHGYHLDSPETRVIKKLLQVALPLRAREIIIDNLFKKYVDANDQAFSDKLYLDLDQLREMRANGMHIGCHGHNHYWFDSLLPEDQRLEIQHSLQLLQDVQADPNYYTICYPFGGYNSDTLHLARELGIQAGFTTTVALAQLNREPALTIPRLDTNDLPKSKDAPPNPWLTQNSQILATDLD